MWKEPAAILLDGDAYDHVHGFKDFLSLFYGFAKKVSTGNLSFLPPLVARDLSSPPVDEQPERS